MSPKWYVIAIALLALAAIFGGGFGVGWGLRAAHDAQNVAGAQGNFTTCKTVADMQTDALTKVNQHTAREKTQADALQRQADALLQARPAQMQQIEQHGRAAAIALRDQAHEDADSAVLARLPVPPAVARRLWPGSAASAGAPANR